MPQDPGARNRRVVIERHGITYDQWNQPVEGWTVLVTAWASWRRATANERLASGQVGAQVTDIFELLWFPEIADLDPKDRLRFDVKTYDMIEVTEVGAREGLLIRASARADT